MSFIYVPTELAISEGVSPNRVYLVINEIPQSVEFNEGLLAWGCEITKQGIVHPNLKKILTISDLKRDRGFKYDTKTSINSLYSLYGTRMQRRIEIEELDGLIRNSKNNATSYTRRQQVALVKGAVSKLTYEERQAIAAILNNVYAAGSLVPEWFKE